MTTNNTVLDDIATEIGFSATLRLAAWYGNSSGVNLYVPPTAEAGQALVNLIGMSAAQRLAAAFGGEHLAIPLLTAYEDELRRRRIARLLAARHSWRDISNLEGITERRVQQICRGLEQAGLIAPVVPVGKTEVAVPVGKTGAEKCPGKTPPEKCPGKTGAKNAPKKPAVVPAAWVGTVVRNRLR